MRVLTALTLLFLASCTFDYGALRGTGRDGDAGDDDASDAGDALADRPLLPDLADVAADAEGPPSVDADLDSAPDTGVADAPLPVGKDAAWEAGPVMDGADAYRATDTQGAGGGTGGAGTTGTSAGGIGGSVVGGSVSTQVGGSSETGGSTASSSTTGGGGTGGTTSTGGTGGVAVDAGSDAGSDAARDVAVDAAALETRVDPVDVMRPDVVVGDAAGTLCSSGQPMCEGNATCTCNSAGTGCAATAEACTGDTLCDHGTCLLPISDSLSPTPPGTGFSSGSSANVMKVNFYSVASARTLLKVEQYLAPSAVGASLTWVVYRSATQASGSTYDLIAKIKSSSTANSAGYQSSPLLSIPLEVGSSYAIGAYWDSSTSYWYHNVVERFPVAVSFGALIGGMSSPALGAATLTSSLTTSLYYPQRLSTN